MNVIRLLLPRVSKQGGYTRQGRAYTRLSALVLGLWLFVQSSAFAKEPERDLKVYFLDVGQADACLIVTPQRQSILVDAGNIRGGMSEDPYGPTVAADVDAVFDVILPLLKMENLSSIDIALVTHPHMDHFGGYLNLFGRVKIGEIFDAGFNLPSEPYLKFLKSVEAWGIPYKIPAIPSTLQVEPRVELRFLGPQKYYSGTPSDANNSSLLVKVTYGETSFLITGDMELLAELDALEAGKDLRSTVLKIAHHGSRSSSSSVFLDRVAPEIAVFTCGRGNSFGHPHAETLAKLDDRPIRYFRTDIDGNILIKSDGNRVDVDTLIDVGTTRIVTRKFLLPESFVKLPLAFESLWKAALIPQQKTVSAVTSIIVDLNTPDDVKTPFSRGKPSRIGQPKKKLEEQITVDLAE